VSDLQDRFEQLARRGTPRGGDEVLGAARAGVDQDAVAVIAMDPNRRKATRRRFGSLVAAAGVAATLFVCTLAFSAFLGSGSGSDSPEGAVRQLANAVTNEDALAASDVLAPEEVRSLGHTVDSAARRAEELKLAKSATAPLAGLDLSVDNLDLQSETLADGYVKVTVSSGVLSTHTDSTRFAPLIQRVLHGSEDNSSQVDLASLATSLDLPTFVVTVRHDGHWYVSAAYTALEYIRLANQGPPADFGSGVRATSTLGADTPDAAVNQAMQALAHSDWAALISLAPPDEIPAYDYRDALIQLGQDEHTGFTLDTLETTTSSVDGDTAKVRLRASGTTDSGDWSIDGACYKRTDSPEYVYSPAYRSGDWCGLPIGLYVLPYFGAQPDAAKAAEVTVVREQGRWFVSPVGTVLDLVDQYVSQLTQRQLYTTIGVADQLPPDGALTLGTPTNLGDPVGGASVLTMDAKRGQRLLGLATAPTDLYDAGFAALILVFSPDGTLLPNTYDLIDGRGLQIPADGVYKVVIVPYYKDQTFTVWDEASAPEAAKHPPTESVYDGCTATRNGGMTCSSSASASTPSGQCTSTPNGDTSCVTGGSSESCVSRSDGSTECSSSSKSSGSTDRASASTSTTAPGG
jgi:hypothetical protein